MKGMSYLPVFIFIVFLFLIDLYTSRGLRILTENISTQWLVYGIRHGHWVLFILFSIWILIATFNAQAMTDYKNYKYFYFLFGLILLFYLPKLVFSVFLFADDVLLLGKWLVSKVTPNLDSVSGEAAPISRSRFLNQVGIITATVPFIGAAYGMIKGRFDFRVIQRDIKFPELPSDLDGFVIAQISDAHLGSFFDNQKPVERAIEMLNSLKPDILVFTGDLVNNFAAEAEDWVGLFNAITPEIPKYSILGNHDYGDYAKWPSESAKRENLERLKQIHSEMGFTLLLNSHDLIERGAARLGILGVENWGVPPFPQHGDVGLAKTGMPAVDLKVLLSHDPSHWDHQIKKEHKDIDLTLSGHTHGMQFGVELGDIKWSPVQYKYPKWAGLYEEYGKYLYVNRGFGYIGFPGRVGIPPEITVLKLTRT